MYSLPVALTLIGMIIAGAGRIVAVKVYFQMEREESLPETPMFVTLLYLLGQSLSLLVHYVYTRLICSDHQEFESKQLYSGIEMSDYELDYDDDISESPEAVDAEMSGDETEVAPEDENQNGEDESFESPRPKLRRSGSDTGLTEESKNAVAWVHRIPWYLKPMIPGFFNFCNSALRWGCLIFVAASTAEIMISGMELVLSSFAARIIRKRIISTRRWVGVSIITFGILLVGSAKAVEKKETEDEEKRFLIGNVLIFGQCVFSVLQDLSEEIFMQEANFPPTLLLGMEGMFGLIFGAPVYFLFFSEDLSFARSNIGYQVGLVVWVLVTGILNIRTTEVTSSMTRNVWKQFRVILVWILGLAVYYVGSGDMLGEPWVSPASFFVLGGFSVILTGVYFYY